MRVAVVTPYCKEDLQTLRRCHDSVLAQSHPCRHVMIADGRPDAAVDAWDVEHLRLPRAHADTGDTARAIGALHAIGLGVEAVAFLDADNWYRADHVARLVALHRETGAAFLSSGRLLRRLDGSVMGVCPNTDPERFVDTSCMMFTREAFDVIATWVLMPAYAHVIGDRVVLHEVKARGHARAHSAEPSVSYSCGKAGAYLQFGEVPPVGVSAPPDYASAFAAWEAEGRPPLVGPRA
jgi:hypothetical protein